MQYDPIERDKRYRKIFHDVDAEVDAMINAKYGEASFIGRCHLEWHLKKEILKKKHNIDWKSPSEMNPDVCFD